MSGGVDEVDKVCARDEAARPRRAGPGCKAPPSGSARAGCALGKRSAPGSLPIPGLHQEADPVAAAGVASVSRRSSSGSLGSLPSRAALRPASFRKPRR
eukprot:6671291-Prymnesium_polylepis.1